MNEWDNYSGSYPYFPELKYLDSGHFHILTSIESLYVTVRLFFLFLHIIMFMYRLWTIYLQIL